MNGYDIYIAIGYKKTVVYISTNDYVRFDP